MIKNYIKTAFRTLSKNRGFTAINVLGLALGLATCLLIVFYVFDELSYDKYNKNIDRIYRVNTNIKFGGNENSYATAPPIAASVIKEDYPEVEQSTRLRNLGGAHVRKGNQNIQEDKMIYADASIFSIFTLPMLDGNPATALSQPHSLVITESTAKKYFNTTSAVGRTMLFNDTVVYKVTGVIKDIPEQSHFNFDFFIAISGLKESRLTTWLSDNNFVTYLLLKPGTDYKKFEAKMPAFLAKHASQELQTILRLTFTDLEKSGNHFGFSLIPVKDIHLRSNIRAELGANGNIQYVYIFSAVAIFILLIACVNFMNLSTARSSNRAREVGVRKVLGSPRKYLIAQFLTESVLITFAATVIALVSAWLLLPLFNQMSGKHLVATGQVVVCLIPVMLILVLVIGFLAGSYPALFLSGFKPIDVLKGKLSIGLRGGLLRNFLVVFQFAISIFLIIGTLVIYNQLKYIQSKDLGYNRDQVLILRHTEFLGTRANAFKQELKNINGIQSVTVTGALPTDDYADGRSFFKSSVPDQKDAILTQNWPVDEDYIPTLGLKLVAGRNFSTDMITDSSAIVINEAAAKILAFPNPLNQLVYKPTDDELKHLKPYHIIGVIKDFNFQSLRTNVTPMFLYRYHDRGAIAIRFKSENIPAILSKVKNKWSKFSPTQQFNYSFMDDDFDAIYRSEQRTGGIFIAFTTLAIIIACLGLFGLVAYATEQRTKEIGIRKVLGASILGITNMLSKEFLQLVLIAAVIAFPIAWFSMNKWMQGFAYQAGIAWWIFAISGMLAILIAVVTVSFQSVKAALANPVKSLRSE